MRIGIDIRELEKGKFTGIGRYLQQLLTFLSSTDHENEYFLFANQRTHFKPLTENHKVIRMHEGVTFIWDQYQLPKAIKSNKVDILLTPYFKAPVIHHGRLIVIVNDLMPLVVPEYRRGSNFIKRHYFKMGITRAIHSADKIITISNHTKNDLVKLFHVDQDKISVVHLAVEPKYKKMDKVKEELYKKYNLNEKFILYLGNLKPHKNVSGLINAYQQLPEALQEEYPLIIGAKRSFQYKELSTMVIHSGMSNRIFFIGEVEENDLPALYSAATMFVCPSTYEGFGLPVLEAMASATAVVTSNAASLPEVVGDAAVCVDPHNVAELSNAIKKVLTDERFRNELRQKGLKQAGCFTIERMGKKIHEELVHC